MSETIYLTKEGQDKLKEELNHLIKVKKVEVAEKIKEARLLGDVLQNPIYDASVEEQGYIEGRISEIEEVLGKAKLIKKNNKDGAVLLGSTVSVEINGAKETFTIVGSTEADPDNKRISNESPVGRALMGAKVGDVVKIKTPAFSADYKIIKINN